MTSLTGEELEVPAEQLADEKSCFIECEGLKVHYKVEQPQVRLGRKPELWTAMKLPSRKKLHMGEYKTRVVGFPNILPKKNGSS